MGISKVDIVLTDTSFQLLRAAALSNWNEVSVSTISTLEIPIKDRLGAIKEVPQWIKKYHELIVADGFSHL